MVFLLESSRYQQANLLSDIFRGVSRRKEILERGRGPKIPTLGPVLEDLAKHFSLRNIKYLRG